MTEPPAELDLRGEVCPYTFVKTRLALEDLPLGAELVLLLDNPQSADSVPRSLLREGQEVLSVCEQPVGTLWRIHVRKRKE